MNNFQNLKDEEYIKFLEDIALDAYGNVGYYNNKEFLHYLLEKKGIEVEKICQ